MIMGKTILGRVGLVSVGTFVPGKPYLKNDIVSSDVAAYIARKDNKDVPLPDGTDDTWQLIGRIGSDGRSIAVLPNGNFGNWDEATQQYVDTGIPAAAQVDVANAEVNFDQATNRTNIQSGENVKTVFGKICKWLADLKSLAFKDQVDYETDIINAPDIPTNNVHLENGAGYQNTLQVENAINTHNADENAHAGIHSSLTELQRHALTALRVHEGAGISVTVESDSSITLSADIDNEVFITVAELPANGVENKIYLIPKSDPETSNTLDEYIWVNEWELIGSVSVDLADYSTITETVEQINTAISAHNGATDAHTNLQSKHYSVSLAANGWFFDESSNRWQYNVVSNGLKANNTVVFSPYPDHNQDFYIEAEIYSSGMVQNGSFTIYSRNKPENNIVISYSIIN